MESCRRAVRERILGDILGSVNDGTGGGWKVLILDELTTKVLSSSVKMSDILDCNVSVVEDLYKNREPLPLAAVYFVQPNASSINRLCEDFSKKPLYPSVHVFFSSKASGEAIEKIKACPHLIKVVKTLKEVNLEFLTVDSRTVVTDHPQAALSLMSDQAELSRSMVNKELDAIAARLVTLFTTLNEFPVIRYKAARPAEAGDPPGQASRSALPQLLSNRLIEKLTAMQRGGGLPARESCDLLVLDRAYDPVAPIIHEWTYEAMVYDLVPLDGNVYSYNTESGAGQTSTREVPLEESDELWVELRHAFIANVYTQLSNKFKDFQTKNKAAKHSGGSKSEMSGGAIKALIRALPQFRDVLGRMSLHIQLSSDLKTITNERSLTDIGGLEQDLVLGEKTSKELVTFLADHQNLDAADKMRLVMCYLATHPGKLDVPKRQQWQKLAGLTEDDMTAISNLSYYGVSVTPQAVAAEQKGSFFSRTKPAKTTKGIRRKREEPDGEQYMLNRFNPLLLDLLEDLGAGRLSAEEYPYVREPSHELDNDPRSAASARTARPGLNWARRTPGSEQPDGPTGRRLVVFILGGATRSEMRVVHRMAKALGRDVILASTSIDTPHTFIETLYQLSSR